MLIFSMTCASRSMFPPFRCAVQRFLSFSQRRRDHTPKSPRTSACFRLYSKGFSGTKGPSRCSCKTTTTRTSIRRQERSYPLYVSLSSPFLFAHLPGPGNISPYSSGAPGASLTSTSVDPQTATSRLVWDEVCTYNTVVIAYLIIALGGNDV